MMNPLVTPFLKVMKNQQSGLQVRVTAGERFIGYFCTHTPLELIHAAGFTPVRITGGPGPVEKAYAHLPDFICPYLKRTMEKGLEGEYGFLSGLVQAYTCDAACGVTNIWKEVIGGIHHILPLPYNDRMESREYLKSAMFRLIDSLVAAGGSYSESRLDASLDLYRGIREQLIGLHAHLHSGTLSLSAKDLFHIHAAGDAICPEDYLNLLQALYAGLQQSAKQKATGCPVIISGSLVESAAVYDAIDVAGGRVVADDLCNCYRPLIPTDGNGADPIDRLVDRYMNRLPCPSRSRAESRSRQIAALLGRSGARGVILMVQKFCTPHLSDYPILSTELKKLGCPSILIEMDESWQTDGQVATRLAGFIEMLEA